MCICVCVGNNWGQCDCDMVSIGDMCDNWWVCDCGFVCGCVYVIGKRIVMICMVDQVFVVFIFVFVFVIWEMVSIGC